MNARRYGRSVTLLVWTLVATGLLSGAATNALVGWTLFGLNRERLQLMEQDKRLSQGTARLQRLGQEVRGEIHTLLQGREMPLTPSPLAELSRQVAEIRDTHPEPVPAAVLDDLATTVAALGEVRAQAAAWRARFRPLAADLEAKATLGKARTLLEALRAGAEILEGQQRLAEAVSMRRWRQAGGAEAAALAQTILPSLVHNRTHALKEVRSELSELSRLVETLAGENQLDHLTDLKDNQLKPLLERLERQLHLLAEAGSAPPALAPAAVAELRDILFGRGHAVVQEYQTIRLGEGGLYRLASDTLHLQRQREELESRAQDLFGRIERVHPVLAGQAVERGQSLGQRAEENLTRGLRDLLAVNVVFLGGFLGLGVLISKKVRGQVVALARLQRQKELILDSAGEGIVGLDRQGRAIFVNPAGGRLLGWDPQHLLGRPHREFLRAATVEGGDREADPLAAVFETGASFHRHDQTIIRLDGGHVPVEYTATPMRSESGEVEGAVVTCLDITARREAEAALQTSYLNLDALNRSLEEKVADRTRELEAKHTELLRAQEELARREKLAAIGSLAAGVAHEINNPAAIIRGNAEILRRKLPAEGVGREEAVEILESTERISRITRNLLTFAREQTLQPEGVNVNRLLAEVLAQAPHHSPLGQVTVIEAYAADLPLLVCDREKLRQVFTNLVINALEAMAGQGTLSLRTELAAGQVTVTVADSGPGIAPADRERIFDPFFTTKKTGTGLGLSVSYGIVQAMGGRIEVENVGEGAAFTVSLPCS